MYYFFDLIDLVNSKQNSCINDHRRPLLSNHMQTDFETFSDRQNASNEILKKKFDNLTHTKS